MDNFAGIFLMMGNCISYYKKASCRNRTCSKKILRESLRNI
ncbi:hypothetical protein DORFOR_02353 [Dorea formicigenerans ATCC 27755]|uniref:Uncharacterized protein n=1 Tax=Dorea formicigenerans ATCC 27755 TaxID=411461 RepID=B0G7U8_9FIRM|nr:hypothetical protein DORFOR_02353 [Dorea formicigenerans ATCC 27755]